jgi:hypothetical protein
MLLAGLPYVPLSALITSFPIMPPSTEQTGDISAEAFKANDLRFSSPPSKQLFTRLSLVHCLKKSKKAAEFSGDGQSPVWTSKSENAL